MCYGYHIWSEEPLMRAKNDDDLRGGQRSTEVKYSKQCSMAPKLGQNNCWCKLRMMMTFVEVKGQQRSNIVYKYWLLMRGMVENYCPEVKLNPGLLFTEARRAEVNSRPGLSFTEGTIIFYHSPNKRAVNICFIHPIHRFFSPYWTHKIWKVG